MTPETEMTSTTAGRNGVDGSDTTITCSSDAESESIKRNGGRGHGLEGHTRKSGHQWRGGQGGRFNRPAYTSSIINIKVEVEDFGVFLGTTDKQIEAKYQYKRFRNKLKQYILQ